MGDCEVNRRLASDVTASIYLCSVSASGGIITIVTESAHAGDGGWANFVVLAARGGSGCWQSWPVVYKRRFFDCSKWLLGVQ